MGKDDKPVTKKLSFYEKTERLVPIFEILEKSSIIIPFLFLGIGGIFQITSLSQISPSYIRFFSITQLVSDSLVFLYRFISVAFLFSLGLLIGKLVDMFINGLYHFFEKDEQKSYIVHITCMCFITIAFCYFFYKLIFGGSINFLLTCSGFFTVFLVGFVKAVIILVKNTLSLKGYTYYWIFVIIFFIGLYLIFSSDSLKSRIKKEYHYVLTSYVLDNINMDRIHNHYKSKGLKDSLLYSNDQYIFLQLKDGTNKKPKIEVLKFDKFFDDDEK